MALIQIFIALNFILSEKILKSFWVGIIEANLSDGIIGSKYGIFESSKTIFQRNKMLLGMIFGVHIIFKFWNPHTFLKIENNFF